MKWVKVLVQRCLPGAVQQQLRRWYAPRLAARFTDADWPAAPIVQNLIKPGDTVVDVGANIGYITARLASVVGPHGQVYAIEPVPETFDLLTRTVRRLKLDAVRLVHACASSRAGAVTMEVPASQQGGDNLYESRVIESSGSNMLGRRVAVQAMTLDEIVGDAAGPVTFIKIDVEGHEGEVIRGAADLLAQHRPALYIEVSGNPDEPGSPAGKLFDDLGRMGYNPFWLNGKQLVRREAGDKSVDYFFLLSDHESRLSGG